jgi:exosortase E/protease (VPEID-CTERM system)
VWLANALRIAALIAIGTWISPEIAFGGFHSYAGSLLFCAVALSLAHVAGRSRFFATADALEATADTRNPTAAYLGPFLAIVATAMLTGAFSTGTFDALYPLRVVVAAMMLWSFRTVYREWRWTWSWHAVALGIGVFFLWMALEPAATTETPDSDLGTILAGMPAGAAGTWLAFRAFGAIVTVPIVEELAFRGYLLRRFVAADFEGVSPRRFSAPAFLISSVLFGAMHSRLLAGTLAGMAYALALQRRGELCDAVVAHATTNAVLAAYVLATGAWSLWG